MVKSMRSIEQAIEYAEKVANIYEDMTEDYTLDSQRLHKCANEQRQLAEWLRELQRARVLLKATLDLLKAAERNPYVEDVLSMLIYYDDADCDGYCLMEDIKNYFDEFAQKGEPNETD